MMCEGLATTLPNMSNRYILVLVDKELSCLRPGTFHGNSVKFYLWLHSPVHPQQAHLTPCVVYGQLRPTVERMGQISTSRISAMAYLVITKCFPPQNRTASSRLLVGKVPALCYPLYHTFWECISCLMQT